MKQIINLLAIIVILTLASVKVHAQTPTEILEKPSSYSNYKIVTPSILPDNMFYKFIVLKEKFYIMTLATSYQKAAYYQNLADQKLLMATLLAKKNQWDLSRETALKGENYMTGLVDRVKDAVYNGQALDNEIVSKAHNSAKKHQELINILLTSSPENYKKIFSTILEFSNRNDNELSKIELEYNTPKDLPLP